MLHGIDGVLRSIRWLDEQSAITQEHVQPQLRYSMEQLIQAFMFARFLRNAVHFKRAVATALRFALPNALAEQFVAELEAGKTKAPSKTTMVRHRLTILTGWIVVQSEDPASRLLGSASGDLVLVMVDASPQGGRDWLLSSLTIVKCEDLGAVFRAKLKCIRSCSSGDVEGARSAMAFLESSVHARQLIPTAVGSKRSTLAHKMHAFLHAVLLMTRSPTAACSLVRNICAFTTDLGTERLFSRFPKCSWFELFPWCSNPDVGASDTDADCLSFAPPQAVPSEDEGVAAPDVLVFPCDSVPLEIDVSFSLSCHGLLHIVHNATRDLRISMPHWD
eukprot:1061659-Lingulodinium_polyedra.AAC.1